MTDEEAEALRAQAVINLNKAAVRNQALLLTPDPHVLTWTPYEFGMQAKVGRGHLKVCRTPPPGCPGIEYTSSMGANSDDSYGGFLPGVTFDEALQIVYRDYKRNTR